MSLISGSNSLIVPTAEALKFRAAMVVNGFRCRGFCCNWEVLRHRRRFCVLLQPAKQREKDLCWSGRIGDRLTALNREDIAEIFSEVLLIQLARIRMKLPSVNGSIELGALVKNCCAPLLRSRHSVG